MSRVPRALRAVLVLALLLAAAGIGAGFWLRREIRASLAQLDGNRQLTGLGASVTVTRDGLGIPTIRGASREDVARATGFLHGQDRFFQMDLQRRRAAGELAELVGPRAVAADRAIRIHRFRAEAQRALTLMQPADRKLLDAYTAGVNAGLSALGARPFEYLLLRQTPAAWRDEDTFLVVLSMFVTLQDGEGAYESTLGTMSDVLPKEVFDFLAPRGTSLDAPIDGDAFTLPPIPGPEVWDPRLEWTGRTRPKAQGTRPNPGQVDGTRLSHALSLEPWALSLGANGDSAIGSNNFAVSGALTPNGGALVANDMHLSIRVPNIWYRAALEWPGHRMIGVTLPGTPALVVGSNTHVAWGFTNTYADWSDVILLETDAAHPNQYRTPDGWREFESHDEAIKVAGEADQRTIVRWTIWGPLLDPDYKGRLRAYRWAAHSAEQLARSVSPLEDARTVEEAFDAANGLGTPGQNFVVADEHGRIGWSVYGSIPRRVGLDGRLPASWADGTRRWDGWLSPSEYPRITDPANGRIWTANARVVGGDALAKLGDGSYEIGSRASRIRARLTARDRFTPRDLLSIQLDTNAAFIGRWRTVLLETLSPSSVRSGHQGRTELWDLVGKGWTEDVSPDSASYRLTRAFRDLISQRLIGFLLADCYAQDPAFDYTTERKRDAALLAVVTQQPQHLLDPQYATWQEFLLAGVDDMLESVTKDVPGQLSDRVWSEYNVTAYRHPLSAALPFVGRLLDMPQQALPGDLYTPQVHWGSIGASERMIVSPGREAEGIMEMPTGQSGNPMSPFYANSHPAWVNGEPTPFLPGPAEHRLELTP